MRLLVIVLIFISSFVKAQSDSEIGVVAGGAYYMGDVNMSRHLYRTSPALGAIYKMNYTDRFALRVSAIFSKLQAKDSDFKSEYQRARDHSFSTNIMDVAAALEFNFKPFWVPQEFNTYRWTPYVYVGLGYTLAEPDFDINIPLGAGVKFMVRRDFVCAFEWSFRRVFTDQLDGLADPSGIETQSKLLNKDWYSYVGVSFTYRFSSDKACELFDKLFR